MTATTKRLRQSVVGQWLIRFWIWFKGPEIPREKRWKPHVVMNIVCAALIVLLPTATYLRDTYRIGFDVQDADKRCLDAFIFLVTLDRFAELRTGSIYSYVSKAQGPIPEGTRVAKIAAALPGDHVQVNATGIRINGRLWGPINPSVMAKVGHTMDEVTRDYIVPKGQVLMLGDQPRTYDGRYFGPIDAKRIVGTAKVLW